MAQLPSASPETLYCKMIQEYFNLVIGAIDVATAGPQMAFNRLQALIRRIEGVIIDNLLTQLDDAIELVDDLLAFNKLNTNKTKEDFCATLFQCEAVKQLLVDYGIITTDQLSDYNLFEDLVCKNGLARVVESFLDSQIIYLQNLINDILAKINESIFTPIQKGLDKYQEVLETIIYTTPAGVPKSFLDLVNDLSVFMNCVFEACDFAETAINKKLDIEDKLMINKSQVDRERFMNIISDGINEINTKISELNNKLDSLRFMRQGGKVDKVLRDNLMSV